MAHQALEVILMRQLASSLAMPVFIVDPTGTLVFYNGPAEQILGHRFEESGEMPVVEWSTAYIPEDEFGNVFPADKMPLVIALSTQRSSHTGFWITGKDNVRRYIEVTAFPLLAQGNKNLGAVAIFWEGNHK